MGKINIDAMINCDDKQIALYTAKLALNQKNLYTNEEIEKIENYIIALKLLGTEEFSKNDIDPDWDSL